MEKAVNPQTGEVVFLVDNQWVKPTQTAENPDTGERAYLVGDKWEVMKAIAPKTAPIVSTPTPTQNIAPVKVEEAAVPGEVVAPPKEPTVEKPQGTQFFGELAKGAKRAAVADLPSMWEQVGLLKDVGATATLAQRMDLFDKIDKGEITANSPELKTTTLTSGQARSYLATNPEMREKMRQRTLNEIGKRKDLVMASIETIKAYQEDAKQYKPLVDKPRNIGSTADFVNWLGSTMGSGAVQMVPIMLAAAATGGVGLAATSMGMGVSEAIGNRLQFIQKKTKGLPPDKQADAVIEYLEKTGDTTLLAGILSGSLDVLLGPAARLVKVRAGKVADAATRMEAVKREVKAVPKSVLGEGTTGGAQEAIQIAAKKQLGEKPKQWTTEDLIEIAESAAEEAAGSLGGAGAPVVASAIKRPAGAVTPFVPPVTEEPAIEEPSAPPGEPSFKAAPPTARERVEPTLEKEAPLTEVTPENVRATPQYQELFDSFRAAGFTREDADNLARRELFGGEAGLEQAISEGKRPEHVPPVGEWTTPMLVGTWELQAAKSDAEGKAVLGAVEEELTKRNVDVPRLQTLMLEQVDAGVPPKEAATAAVARWREETQFDEEAEKAPPIEEKGERRVGEPVTPPSGESVGVAGEPAARPAATGVGEAERTGMVPAGPAAKESVAGEAGEPTAVEETAPDIETVRQERTAKAVEVAKANASMALDQRDAYESPQEAIDSHRQNVIDTLKEQGKTEPYYVDAALAAYDNAVKEVAPTTEPPTTEPPAAPTKRGRPKLELTPEQQAEKETEKKASRAAYTKADRQAKKASEELDALAQPLDESGFENEAALKEAQAERSARRTNAIRTLLQLQPQHRGTPLAARIKEALDKAGVTEQEKANIQKGIELLAQHYKDNQKKPSPSKDPAAQVVNPLLVKVTNAAQALTAIARTGTPFQKVVANVLRRFVTGVRIVVVEQGQPIPEALQQKAITGEWENARALFVPSPDGKGTVYLRGASFGKDQGVNNVTALHEIWHAAGNAKLLLGLKELAQFEKITSNAARFAYEIQNIAAGAKHMFELLEARGAISPALRNLVYSTARVNEDGTAEYAIFDDGREFLAYGMSDDVFQNFLSAIPSREVITPVPTAVSAFKRFVQAMRNAFNMRVALGIPKDADTLFTNLITASNHLLVSQKTKWMRQAEREEWAEPSESNIAQVSAANKEKARKITRVEKKIQQSEDAQEIVDGLGLLTFLRNPRDFLDTLGAMWHALNVTKLKALLPAIQTDTIVQWADRLGVKGLKEAWRGMQDMDAMRMNMLTASAEIAREWVQLHPGVIGRKIMGKASELKKLAAVMHYATDKGVDPDKSKTDPLANEMWNGLSDQAKKVYRMARNAYEAKHKLYRLLLDQRIAALQIPGDINDPDTPKGRIMAEIKRMYEMGKIISPYFPLMRYGDYWLRIGKGPTQQFYMFESIVDREQFLKKELRKTAETNKPELEVERGNSMRELRNRSASTDTSELLKDIFDAVDKVGSFADKEDIKDQIYQLYLTTMPEQSFRRQFIHRKGTAGYSGDALRNFITSSLNMANQLARLKYGPRILGDITRAKESLKGNPDKDRLEMFADEIFERAKLDIMPPAQSKFLRSAANVTNRVAFLYYMTSVKTALSQFSSLPIFGVPVLMSRHAPVKVAKEMSRFMNVFTQLGVTKEDAEGKVHFVMPTITESSAIKLSPEEMQAVEAMRDRGLADVTMTYELMDRRATPTTKYIGAWKTGTNIMGALFHNVERMNREVMFMTSFRLSLDELNARRVKGAAAVEAAIEQAVDDTYSALGNFVEGNRPRVMRSSVGKIALQFKVFPTFLTTYMVRNFYRMLPLLNKEGKKEAATQFFGTLGLSSLLAGYIGIPGITAAMGAAQALKNLFADDDEEDPLEKKDLEMWMRAVWIPNMFGEAKIGGKKVGEILDAGVLNSISGYDLTSSLSMNNIWFPELKESATYQAEMQDYMLSLAGPGMGLLTKQIPGAMDDFRAGKFYRGTEKLMPNLIRQPMMAYRYSQEGVLDSAGRVVKDKDEFTKGQLLMQALGFRTEGLADVQTANFKANAIRRQVMNEKNRLISRLDLEAAQGSDEAMDKALDEVLKFNSRYPMASVKAKQLSSMLENRIKARVKADRGFQIDKRYYPYLEELLETSRGKIEREAAKP